MVAPPAKFRRLPVLIVLVLVAVLIAACGRDRGREQPGATDASTEATIDGSGGPAGEQAPPGLYLQALLAGGTSGDPDGTGSVALTVEPEGGNLCSSVTTSGLDTIVAIHLHEIAAGSERGIIASLPSGQGQSATISGCGVELTEETVERLKSDPGAFQVDVHTQAFPGAALQGQLSKQG